MSSSSEKRLMLFIVKTGRNLPLTAAITHSTKCWKQWHFTKENVQERIKKKKIT